MLKRAGAVVNLDIPQQRAWPATDHLQHTCHPPIHTHSISGAHVRRRFHVGQHAKAVLTELLTGRGTKHLHTWTHLDLWI